MSERDGCERRVDTTLEKGYVRVGVALRQAFGDIYTHTQSKWLQKLRFAPYRWKGTGIDHDRPVQYNIGINLNYNYM